MNKHKELWRSLRVGELVRLIEVPAEFFQPGYNVHRDTMHVYKRLVARRRPLRVAYLDELGLPWIRCRFRRKEGGLEYHVLMINHDGLVRVKPRRNRRK